MNGGSPGDVLIQYLVDNGLATRQSSGRAWPCFLGSLPDGDSKVPDDALSVDDTIGMVHGICLRDGQVFEHFGIQVISRSKSYRDGWNKLSDIAEKLSKVSLANVTVNGMNYVLKSITRKITILHLEQEVKNRRDLFAFNAVVAISKGD